MPEKIAPGSVYSLGQSLWYHWLVGLVCVMVLAACAGPQIRPEGLRVTVQPQEITPGCIVTVEVAAPAGTRDVKGKIDIYGSPTVPLKSRDQGRTWYFRTQVPLEAAWQSGRYRVLVWGLSADNVELQGETWVNAP